MTESTGELAKALAAFQGEMPTVPKTQTAKVPTKAGGSYTYTYAGLADVAEVAMPLLARHGLAFTCLPTHGDVGAELVGMLLHTSGESLSATLPIFGRTAQEIGSSLTYGRRYLLGCMTGLVTDDDDDGAASNTAKRTRQQRPPAQQQQPPPEYEQPITAKTRKALFALFGEVGISQEDDQRAFLSDTLGRPVESRGSLTEAEGVSAGKRLRRIQQGDPAADWAPSFDGAQS